MRLLQRDLTLIYRAKSQWLNPLAFFVLVAVLFPLGTSAQPHLLKMIGPGVIWIAALFANVLALPQLFTQDEQDGSLEQVLLQPNMLSLVWQKLIAQFVMYELPLIVISPVLALFYHFTGAQFGVLLLTLLLGLPMILLLGAIGAALTTGLQQSGVLLALILLPFYIPTLIFGVGAMEAVSLHQAFSGMLALQGAMLIIAMVLAPWGVLCALKIAR